MRIEMDQGNEQIDFGGAWQTLIFWICNFDFANPPMASRLQATAKSAGMHMAAAEAGDLAATVAAAAAVRGCAHTQRIKSD